MRIRRPLLPERPRRRRRAAATAVLRKPVGDARPRGARHRRRLLATAPACPHGEHFRGRQRPVRPSLPQLPHACPFRHCHPPHAAAGTGLKMSVDLPAHGSGVARHRRRDAPRPAWVRALKLCCWCSPSFPQYLHRPHGEGLAGIAPRPAQPHPLETVKKLGAFCLLRSPGNYRLCSVSACI